MSVERSPFEYRVHTIDGAGRRGGGPPANWSGPSAKPGRWGRNSFRLESNWFGSGRGCGIFAWHTAGLASGAWRRRRPEEAREMRQAEEEMEAGKRGFRRRSAKPSQGAAREDGVEPAEKVDAGEIEDNGVTTRPRPETGALSEVPQASATEVGREEGGERIARGRTARSRRGRTRAKRRFRRNRN